MHIQYLAQNIVLRNILICIYRWGNWDYRKFHNSLRPDILVWWGPNSNPCSVTPVCLTVHTPTRRPHGTLQNSLRTETITILPLRAPAPSTWHHTAYINFLLNLVEQTNWFSVPIHVTSSCQPWFILSLRNANFKATAPKDRCLLKLVEGMNKWMNEQWKQTVSVLASSLSQIS